MTQPMNECFLDRYYAYPIALAQYAHCAALTVSDWCKQLGLPVGRVQTWAHHKRVPWSVWEASITRFGALGFHPDKFVIKPPQRPYRLPARFGPEQQPAPPPSPTVTRRHVEDAILNLVLALEADLTAVIHQRLTQIEQRLDLVQHGGNGARPVAAAPPTPPQPRPWMAPHRRALAELLAEVGKDSPHIWVATPRAEREYGKLDPQAQAAYRKLILDVAHADDPVGWKHHGSVRLTDGVSKRLGEPEVWALRANRTLRLFVARNGETRKIVEFTTRSNRAWYQEEGRHR